MDKGNIFNLISLILIIAACSLPDGLKRLRASHNGEASTIVNVCV